MSRAVPMCERWVVLARVLTGILLWITAAVLVTLMLGVLDNPWLPG